MNAWYLLVVLPSMAIAIFMAYRHWPSISPLELGAQLVICAALVGALYSMGISSQTHDVEYINGIVTGKEQNRVSCSHSYQCNCRTVSSGSGSNRTTSTVCDTCYEHWADYDWDVHTTVGSFSIDRIDRQGTQQPSRWTNVLMGEPATLPHGYTNWVKAAPDSLFHTKLGDARFDTPLPDYPEHYDYYHADRVIGHGVNIPQLRGWNNALAQVLGRIGAPKQANIVIVMTKENEKFAEALRARWIGGKKNDVIVVIGVDTYPAIKWVNVFSWSKFDLVNVSLRSDLMASKVLDPMLTTAIIEQNIMKHYVRRPMKEFEYLADDISPPVWSLILCMIIGAGASFGLSRFFHSN